MSTSIGLVIVLGVKVAVNSQEARKFILAWVKKRCAAEYMKEYNMEPIFDHFDEYYDFYVLKSGSEPKYEIEYDCDELFASGIENNVEDYLSWYRQPCCLSKGWKDKIVIGQDVLRVYSLWKSPQSAKFPSIDDDVIENVKFSLAHLGIHDEPRTFFILDECIRCT